MMEAPNFQSSVKQEDAVQAVFTAFIKSGFEGFQNGCCVF